MKKLFVCLISAIGFLLLEGCMTTPGGVAPSTIPLTSKDGYVVLQKDVEGNSWCISLIGFDLWMCSPNMAIQDAKVKNNCDGLINAQLNTTVFMYMYKCYHVSGDAIKVVNSK